MIYQIKIQLAIANPRIWRRVLMPAGATLRDLHRVIQVTLGWSGQLPHLFVIDKTMYGVPGVGDEPSLRDESAVTLAELICGEKFRFHYDYNFEDHCINAFELDMVVEKLLPVDPRARYPTCIKGSRQAPPEDYGAIWGGFNGTLRGGVPFDPEAFDIEAVNKILQSFA